MPNYTKKEINTKLVWLYEELSKEYNVFYIALYGSQNYNLQSENSDLDFKCIIIPTLEELVNQTKPTSKVYTYDWWQVEIKDIRNYIESAVKVNVNFIELLNTEYWYSEHKEAEEFRKFFTPLLNEQGQIYLRACNGMIMQKWNAFSHPYPSKLEVISKYWYDPKQLCHIVRLRMLMDRYTRWDYSFFHDWEEQKDLIEIKNWKYSYQDWFNLANAELTVANRICYLYSVIPTFETKYKMIQFSRDLIIKTIKENLWKSY